MSWLAPALAAGGVMAALLPLVLRGRPQANFRGRPVILGGFTVPLAAAAGWLVRLRVAAEPSSALLLFGVAVMTGLGLLDDRLDRDEVKGLRAHWRRWERGGDTALAKAAGGLAVGLVVGLRAEGGGISALADAFLVALAANALNLLDLRPGRALKGFGIGVLGLAFLVPGMLPYLAPLLVAALLYAPFDLRERLMLGDAGSNALGAALGIGAALSLALPAELFLIGGLGVLHWYAERESVSRLVERVGWLSFLDRLGRQP